MTYFFILFFHYTLVDGTALAASAEVELTVTVNGIVIVAPVSPPIIVIVVVKPALLPNTDVVVTDVS
tara:strand:- start:5 stop:205 length:201 start_codon:yes stop_codon:yes gene_type:complete